VLYRCRSSDGALSFIVPTLKTLSFGWVNRGSGHEGRHLWRNL
jgi:hypothetical protein